MKKIMMLWVLAQFVFGSLYAQNITDDKMDWFLKDKFGLFIHWGLYSQAAGLWKDKPYRGNEHFMLYEKIPWKEYRDSLAKKFNPVKFNAEEWVLMAKKAGMKYIVITTKHHDGFAMFNSPSSKYDIVHESPYGKDPMKQLAAGCKKYGIKLCFYYSLGRDWQDPDVPTNWPTKAGRSNTWDFPNEDAKDLNKYIDRKVLPQLKELLTQYGPIGVIWFDTPELFTKEQSQRVKDFILSIQPKCIVNSRVGNNLGDFEVREQTIGDRYNKPWESNITMSRGWGYNRFDNAWKSSELLVRQLTEIVSKGGNYLLNVGPKGDGAFPAEAVARLKDISKWMQKNAEAIYGTTPFVVDAESAQETKEILKADTSKNTMVDVYSDNTSRKIFPELRFTQKGNIVYVFVNGFSAPRARVKALAASKGYAIEKLTALENGRAIQFTQNKNYLEIPLATLPANTINVRVFKVYVKK